MDKVRRNLTAFVESNTEFENALNKGTTHCDDDEVKEKHITYMLECFSGKHVDLIKPLDALYIYLGKHIEYKHEFRRNIKSFITLHRAIEFSDSSPMVSEWLMEVYPELKTGNFISNPQQSIQENQSKDGLSLETYRPKNGIIHQNIEIFFQVELSQVYSQYVKKDAMIMINYPQPPNMDNMTVYEEMNFQDLTQTVRALNSLLEILVDIFYRLQLDKPTIELNDAEKKEYAKNIAGQMQSVQAKNIQYMKQKYWSFNFIQQMIRLLFQDHMNYYFRSFRLAYELFRRAQDPSKELKLEEYQTVFELWQLFLTQSDQLFIIRKILSDKFKISINQQRGAKFNYNVFNQYAIEKSMQVLHDAFEPQPQNQPNQKDEFFTERIVQSFRDIFLQIQEQMTPGGQNQETFGKPIDGGATNNPPEMKKQHSAAAQIGSGKTQPDQRVDIAQFHIMQQQQKTADVPKMDNSPSLDMHQETSRFGTMPTPQTTQQKKPEDDLLLIDIFADSKTQQSPQQQNRPGTFVQGASQQNQNQTQSFQSFMAAEYEKSAILRNQPQKQAGVASDLIGEAFGSSSNQFANQFGTFGGGTMPMGGMYPQQQQNQFFTAMPMQQQPMGMQQQYYTQQQFNPMAAGMMTNQNQHPNMMMGQGMAQPMMNQQAQFNQGQFATSGMMTPQQMNQMMMQQQQMQQMKRNNQM